MTPPTFFPAFPKTIYEDYQGFLRKLCGWGNLRMYYIYENFSSIF